jgi:hypothetical protein
MRGAYEWNTGLGNFDLSEPEECASSRPVLQATEFSVPANIDENTVRAVFALPETDGSFTGTVARYLAQAGARRPILLLAFAPKSAGTYFREAAIRALDGQLVRLVHAQGGRDGALYLPSVLFNLLDRDASPPVGHVHMQALEANVNFIDALGMKPVIMLRDLADMLASFLDMLERDPAARAEGLNCQIPDGFPQMAREKQLDFMVDVIAPWYASYYATWKCFAEDAPETVCVLTYGEFRRAPADTLYAALAHAGFDVTRARCAEALDAVWPQRRSFRFNRGETGRGRIYFSPAQMEKLNRLLSYYPQLEDWMPALLGGGGQSSARPPSTMISAPST